MKTGKVSFSFDFETCHCAFENETPLPNVIT